ncbi:MAG: amino acid ABC transporter permease [Acutalibacteraceae bacterium]|nr:amino acid ABC transporter permease [Acutalibacteraceae bacterium]
MSTSFWDVTFRLFTEGFLVTLNLFIITLIFSLPLGLIISFGSMSKIKILKKITRTFVWIIRGTPLMLQLLVVYYGPGLIFGTEFNLTEDIAAYLTFIINYACYFSEIFRGGIESIPKGQYEAGKVLGMSKSQTFFRVILLQVVKNVLPPTSNEVITLVKDTSLARIILVYELIFTAEEYIRGAGAIWPLFYTGVFYLISCGLLTILFNKIEKKLSYFSV